MTPSCELLFLKVSPGAEGAREARLALESIDADIEISNSEFDALRLSIAEWVTNLGQHPDRLPNEVVIKLALSGDTYFLEFQDDGSPFRSFEESIENCHEPFELAEAGQGLKLIARYFPAVSYVSRNKRNRFRIQCHRENCGNHPFVLLVDDDPVFLRLYGEYLKGEFRSFSADTADEALHLLRRVNIDLIISDICMPEANSGLGLCAKIRRDANSSTIPLIFLTGDQRVASRAAAQNLAIDGYLLKPIRKVDLIDCARRVFKNASFIRAKLGDRFDEGLTQLLHPSLPQRLGNYNTAVEWRAVESGGGDLIFHRRDKTGTLVVMSDLMGHGAQAKFYSQALAGYLSGMLAAQDTIQPDILMEILNKAFSEDPHLNRTLATTLALRLSDDGNVQASNAGHPKPYIVDPNGIQLINTEGPLLGLLPKAKFELTEFKLSEGQRIFLYTDGLTEIGETPSEHVENLDLTFSWLTDIGTLSTCEAAKEIMMRLERSLDQRVSDDITFALLEYSP